MPYPRGTARSMYMTKTGFDAMMLVRAHSMAKRKLSDKQIAEELGVEYETFREWLKFEPNLRDLITYGREDETDYTLLDEFPDLTPKQVKFLSAFSVCGTTTKAQEMSGVSAMSLTRWRRQDRNGFMDAFAFAKEQSREVLLEEARRRAVEGVEKLKFHNGAPIMIPCEPDELGATRVGKDHRGYPVYMKMYVETTYSDTLMIKLLEHLHPEFIPKTVQHEHSGGIIAAVIDASARRQRTTVIDDDFIEGAVKRITEEKGNGRMPEDEKE